MSRRAKLTRADREKRSEKRERRAEGADERIASREARERWARLPRRMREMYQRIGNLYELMTRSDPYPLASQVVCETCGLAQPYWTDEHESELFPQKMLKLDGINLTLCQSEALLEIPCDGQYCVTVGRFSGS